MIVIVCLWTQIRKTDLKNKTSTKIKNMFCIELKESIPRSGSPHNSCKTKVLSNQQSNHVSLSSVLSLINKSFQEMSSIHTADSKNTRKSRNIFTSFNELDEIMEVAPMIHVHCKTKITYN